MPSSDTSGSMELARDFLCRQGLVEMYFLEHADAGDATIYQFWRNAAEKIFRTISDEIEKCTTAELGVLAACGRGTRVRLGNGVGDDPIPIRKKGRRTLRFRSIPAVHLPIRGGDPGWDGVTKMRLLAAQAVMADIKDLFKQTIHNQVARRHEHALARA